MTPRVVNIVDGDTIDVEIEGKTYRVRYIGMDTPERGRPFFSEATEANRKLVEGKTVVVEKDVSDTDRYGRLLLYVYLEDVDPEERVTYITEGQLRALHRTVSTQPPYELSIPYHSFEEADGEPLVPGEITKISFGLLPTSVVIAAGHRIRVAIAGHDDGLFARVPEAGNPVITVERNSIHASKIELPLVRRQNEP